jgi:hypothetical protein
MGEASSFDFASFAVGIIGGFGLMSLGQIVHRWWTEYDDELERLKESEKEIERVIREIRYDLGHCPANCNQNLISCTAELYEQLLEVRRQIVRHRMGGKPVATVGDEEL